MLNEFRDRAKVVGDRHFKGIIENALYDAAHHVCFSHRKVDPAAEVENVLDADGERLTCFGGTGLLGVVLPEVRAHQGVQKRLHRICW